MSFEHILLLLLTMAAAFYVLGRIWFGQIVVYPLFANLACDFHLRIA